MANWISFSQTFFFFFSLARPCWRPTVFPSSNPEKKTKCSRDRWWMGPRCQQTASDIPRRTHAAAESRTFHFFSWEGNAEMSPKMQILRLNKSNTISRQLNEIFFIDCTLDEPQTRPRKTVFSHFTQRGNKNWKTTVNRQQPKRLLQKGSW